MYNCTLATNYSHYFRDLVEVHKSSQELRDDPEFAKNTFPCTSNAAFIP